ncbi:MAG: alkaline phosphatase D family protein [Methylophilus sp.]|nr:alkaline phosphatase D family protein [Methylophilus sp.]
MKKILIAISLIPAFAQAALPNGVASGDVTQNSAWLWARSDTAGVLNFEVSTDAGFSNIVSSFSQTIVDPMQPVKGLVSSLTAGQQYYYRATDALGATFNGGFRTANAQGTYNGLKFGVTGDFRGEIAPFPSISNMPSKNLDFVVNLGDTMYAERYSGPQTGQAATTLSDYRSRQNEVLSTTYGQNTMRDVRASTPIYAMIDDHEVVNDFAGGAIVGNGYYNDTQRYKDGLQAFNEYQPIANNVYSGTGDARFDGKPNLYRAQNFGSDAMLIMADARSFRDAGLTPWNGTQADAGRFLTESATADRTMLGKTQLDVLKSDLLTAKNNGTTWKIVNISEPTQNLGLSAASDRYEGYAKERTELLSFIDANHIDNVVFITADIHGTLVNDLTYSTNGVTQTQSGAWEISTGAAAFEEPFGPTVVDLATQIGALSAPQLAYYNSLTSDYAKDQFIKALVNAQITPLGYSPLGLEGSGIPVTNLMPTIPGLGQLDYSVVTHTFGWTEFEIDANTQALTVTTYGIADYTYDQLTANPSLITSLTPQVMSKFSVAAVPEPEAYSMLFAGLALIGFASRKSRKL